MDILSPLNRRQLVIAGLSGASALTLARCKSGGAAMSGGATAGGTAELPLAPPTDWDPIAFNRARGLSGFIPASYQDDISGPDGDKKHLGKHLPYVPGSLAADKVGEGELGLMWGDPSKGYAKHPNAAPSETTPEGHYYNWVKVMIAGRPETEVETLFKGWPKTLDGSTGRLTGLEGEDPAADGGRNSVYVVRRPQDVGAGTVLRVWAHCLTHGEYVDFVTLS